MMKLTGRARARLLAALLVGLLAVGGGYAFRDRAQGASVVNQQALARTMYFPDIRMRLVPASARSTSATPRITAVKALRAYRDDAVPPGLDKEAKGPPVASLAVFTSGTGDTSGMAPTLVWLLKFNDVPVIEFGPNSRGVDSGSRCPFYVVVDASSGKRLLSYQTCAPPKAG
jgi:hypothetical protein